jgi:hypothetical protein
MKASEFDCKFDAGEDITPCWTCLRPPSRAGARRVNDFPAWMVQSLDREAASWASPPIAHKALVGREAGASLSGKPQGRAAPPLDHLCVSSFIGRSSLANASASRVATPVTPAR